MIKTRWVGLDRIGGGGRIGGGDCATPPVVLER